MHKSLSLILLAGTIAWAQKPAGAPSQGGAKESASFYDPFFPKASYFRKHFGAPPERIELGLPAHLEDYVNGNRLELSLKAYIELVMANSPDIATQKLLVEINRDAITRAYAIFDPIATARFTTTRSKSPASSALSGAATLNQLTQPLTLGYTQTIETGGTFNINFNGTKTSSNSSFATFNPSLNDSLNFGFTQPLLRGRGATIVKLPISIARSRLKAANSNLEDQVTQLLVTAELAYWSVIEARENLRVAEESLKLAEAALQRSEKELELGATSPLEIFQPQANKANAELVLTQARFNLAQAEDALRRQMGADLIPRFRVMSIALTETVAPPAAAAPLDREKLVEQALNLRQDLRSVRQTVAADDLNVKLVNDGLRPNLSFNAQYGASGQGGPFYSRQNVFQNDGTSSVVTSVIPGGITDALSQMFGFGFPTYTFGLSLQLPIKDRATAANLADAVVQRKLDVLTSRVAEQNIRLQVLQAIARVESSKESVRIAQIARDLAQKRVDADQKRYELGTTTIFFVLASQNDLTTAESNLVRESINYKRNQLSLLRATGRLLEERGVATQ